VDHLHRHRTVEHRLACPVDGGEPAAADLDRVADAVDARSTIGSSVTGPHSVHREASDGAPAEERPQAAYVAGERCRGSSPHAPHAARSNGATPSSARSSRPTPRAGRRTCGSRRYHRAVCGSTSDQRSLARSRRARSRCWYRRKRGRRRLRRPGWHHPALPFQLADDGTGAQLPTQHAVGRSRRRGRSPSGSGSVAITGAAWAAHHAQLLPGGHDHTRTVWSSEPVTSRSPSGENTATTPPHGGRRARRAPSTSPCPTGRIVASRDPVASRSPWRETAHVSTHPSKPPRVCTGASATRRPDPDGRVGAAGGDERLVAREDQMLRRGRARRRSPCRGQRPPAEHAVAAGRQHRRAVDERALDTHSPCGASTTRCRPPPVARPVRQRVVQSTGARVGRSTAPAGRTTRRRRRRRSSMPSGRTVSIMRNCSGGSTASMSTGTSIPRLRPSWPRRAPESDSTESADRGRRRRWRLERPLDHAVVGTPGSIFGSHHTRSRARTTSARRGEPPAGHLVRTR